MTSRFIKAMGSSAIALLLLWNTNVSAQDAPKPQLTTQAQAKAGDPDGFEEIIVTARRREERLQDVPVAATAFSAKDLDRYQTTSLQQIAALTPQLKIGDSGDSSGGVISLRGVGSPSAGISIDQAVSINIDGIQFSQAQALRIGLYDIERVEVLKGPQALFFGKNSPAGVISIISKNPGDKFEASARVGYEFANERKYGEGMISGPLSNALGGRIDVSYGNQSGYFRNDSKPIPAVLVPGFLGGNGVRKTDAGYGSTQKTGPDQKDYSVRGTLTYKSPDSIFDATIKASFGKIDRNNGVAGYSNQFVGCPLGVPQYVAFLGTAGSTDCKLDRTYNEVNIAPGVIALDPQFNRNNGKQYFISEQSLLSATLNFKPTDHLTVTSVTGYYQLKEHVSGNYSLGDLDFVQSYGDVDIKQFSQEVRLLSSFSSPLNFMVGGYYQHVDNDQRNFAVFGSPLSDAFTRGFLTGYIPSVNNAERLKTKASSVFGQAILDVTPQIQLTAGGRYSKEEKNVSIDALTPGLNRAPVFNIPIAINKRSFNNFSPELTATYKPVNNLTLYAAYRTGFKSGGFDLNPGTINFGATSLSNDFSFEQEKVKGFEMGAKGSLLDRQLIFDLAAFRFNYSGLQVSAFDSATFGYRIRNAASAIVQGVELSSQIRPKTLNGLTLRSSISYTDATFGNFANAPCYTGESIVAGCSGTFQGGGFTTQNLTGRPLGRAPKWNGNIGGTYEYGLAGGAKIALSADEIYTDSYYASPALDERSKQRDAWRLNSSLSVRGQDDRWEIALIGTNLAQVLRVINAYGIVGTGNGTGTAGALANDLIGSPSEVRTVTLQGTIKF